MASPRSAWFFLAGVLFCLLCVAVPAGAQDAEGDTEPSERAETEGEAEDAAERSPPSRGDEGTRARPRQATELEGPTEISPWALSDDELRERGWHFERREGIQGSLVASLVAMTGGLFVHGAGHLFIGDSETARRLIAMQAVSLVLLASSAVVVSVADPPGSSVPADQLRSLFDVTGASLFFASWIADIVGSFQGENAPLPPNTENSRGVAVELQYRNLSLQGFGLKNFLAVRVPFERTAFFLRPEASVAVENLAFSDQDDFCQYCRFGVAAGVRGLYTKSGRSFASLTLRAREELVLRHGYGRDSGELGVGYTLDLGDIFPHMRGLYWSNEVGVLVESFFFPGTSASARFSGDSIRMDIPLSFRVSVNPRRSLNVALGYRHRQDLLVGALSPRFGSIFTAIAFVPRNRVGLDFTVEGGEGYSFALGIRRVFGGRAEPVEP